MSFRKPIIKYMKYRKVVAYTNSIAPSNGENKLRIESKRRKKGETRRERERESLMKNPYLGYVSSNIKSSQGYVPLVVVCQLP
jgi:hypothetical protein